MTPFSDFWAEFPKLHDKAGAMRIWTMMTPKEQALAVEAAVVFNEIWRRADREHYAYCPFPTTWLKQRRWEDSPVTWAKSAGVL